MNYVYVIYTKPEDKFYIGYTKDIERREKEHKVGNTHTTKRYQEKDLIFYEVFVNEEDARRREKYFKTTKGKRALRIILKETLE